MTVEKLPPIPTPPAQRWREFRVQLMPALVFGLALAAAVALWRQSVYPPSLVGELESVQAPVSSPQAGALAQLAVVRFHSVSAGDPVARIVTTDPRIIEASLAVIRAEVDLLRAGVSPALDQHRNLLDYERLRLEWLQQRVELATARVNLQRAENELRRASQLFQEKLLSEDQYELAKTTKEALETEVQEKSRMIADIEPTLQRLESAYPADAAANPLQAAIGLQDKKLKLTEAQLNPITLTAPLTGVVTMVHRLPGENVIAGEPIITISATDSDRIIAFVPQPLAFEPQVGMPVKIRTRSSHRQIAVGEILHVGVQLEPVTPSLLRPGIAFERGLPIHVNRPAGLHLRAGELVDLVIGP